MHKRAFLLMLLSFIGLLFITTFVVTSVGYEIAERPVNANAECRMQNAELSERFVLI